MHRKRVYSARDRTGTPVTCHFLSASKHPTAESDGLVSSARASQRATLGSPDRAAASEQTEESRPRAPPRLTVRLAGRQARASGSRASPSRTSLCTVLSSLPRSATTCKRPRCCSVTNANTRRSRSDTAGMDELRLRGVRAGEHNRSRSGRESRRDRARVCRRRGAAYAS
jgi:hypothetical protein